MSIESVRGDSYIQGYVCRNVRRDLYTWLCVWKVYVDIAMYKAMLIESVRRDIYIYKAISVESTWR